MQTLYTYISNKERDEITDQLIQQAIKNYLETRNVLLIIYVLLSVILIVGGFYALAHHTIPTGDASSAVTNATANPQTNRGVQPSTCPKGAAPASPLK
jgi:hypothetical protein